MSTPQSLIVPIDIVALCVGETDVNGSGPDPYGTKKFARITDDFSMIPYRDSDGDPVNLRANVSQDMLAAPFLPVQSPLQQGIHLHWALPDAVSRGNSGSTGSISFPEAPNRWLVVRIATNHAAPGAPVTSVKGWVVESDRLWDESTEFAAGPKELGVQNAMSQAVPTQPTFDINQLPNKSYQMMGRVFSYEAWSETPGGTYIAKNTVLGYGIPSYAAAYVHCPNVFGLYDPLTDLDLKAFPPASTQLSYMVAGWYSNSANDPLNTLTYPAGADNAAKLAVVQKALKWTFAIDIGSPFPTSSICNGLLTAIKWDPAGPPYIKKRSGTAIDVAVGNTTAEALSALIASRPQFAQLPNVERVLNALQLNILSKLAQPDGLAKLEEALHQNDFGSTNAGKMWMIKKVGANDGAGGQPVTGNDLLDAAATLQAPLPPELAGALNRLNIAQAKSDRARFEIESLRGQIFIDWYKYMILEYPTSAPPPDDPTANGAFEYIREMELEGLQQRLTELELLDGDLKAQIDALTPRLGKDYTLTDTGAPRYWQAGEPVLLLSGDDVRPSNRYGGDGRYNADNFLVCRLSSAIIRGMQVSGTSYNVSASMLPKLPSSPSTSHVAELAALVGEAFFLDPNQAWVLMKAVAGQGGGDNPAVKDPNTFLLVVQAAQRALFPNAPPAAGAGATAVDFLGVAPSPVGFKLWTSPWIPLLMQWEANYYPFQPIDAQGDERGAYAPDFITSNYRLDQDAIELIYQQPVPSQLPLPQWYRGTSLLTRNAEINIKSQIDLYIQAYPDDPHVPELKTIRDNMQLSMMAQTLDGFNQNLMMRTQTLQLPVFDPLGAINGRIHYDFSNDDVRNAVAGANLFAPMPLSFYNPLRAGYMSISELRIIDAFGQVLKVNISRVIRSETLIPEQDNPKQPTLMELPPRGAQPSRLLFRWLSASDDLVEMNNDPASTPVFGWVLFNHLDDSLMIYDADGKALGSFNVQGPFWQGAPGDEAAYNKPIEQVFANANPHLKAFALGINANPDRQAFLADMLAAIDRTATMVEPGTYQEDQGLAVLIGRPLALVRASLGLELEGLPALNQSWPAFAAAVDAGTPDNRDDAKFTGVRFPVRLGDLSQVNDGLIGYFIEDGSANVFRKFYAAASRRTSHGVIPPAFDQLSVTGNPAAPATFLTMLVDPRGAVHATTGFLPVKSIGIPPNMYSNALGNMAVTFLTAPVLASIVKPAIPVPEENGYTWSWVMNDHPNGWKVTGEIADADSKGPFSQLPQEIEEGWLRLKRNE